MSVDVALSSLLLTFATFDSCFAKVLDLAVVQNLPQYPNAVPSTSRRGNALIVAPLDLPTALTVMVV